MIRQLVVSLLLSLLPMWLISYETKYLLGTLLNELFRNETVIWLKDLLKIRQHEVVIKGVFNNGPLKANQASNPYNILYIRFQTYLINKFKSNMKNYELVHIEGDLKFNLNDMGNECFTDTYEKHTIHITIRKEAEDDKEMNTIVKSIVLRSKSASPDVLKKYVKENTLSVEENKTINIFNPTIADKTVKWEYITIKTNKTLKNTIYNSKVKQSVFEDVKQFINNEEWYKYRGIPYKRGYFLYGPPGTGKTSVAKIMASTYNIPIYNLDLSVVDNNEMLTKSMLDIHDNTNSHYILLLEDVENSHFFKNKSNITMDCFLNTLDGVMEPYGRILIITSNTPEQFQEHKALMRPGRIDRYIEIGHCTKEQITEMFQLFYTNNPYQPDWDKMNLENLSPAYVIGHLQDNLENPDQFCKIFLNK